MVCKTKIYPGPGHSPVVLTKVRYEDAIFSDDTCVFVAKKKYQNNNLPSEQQGIVKGK